MMFKLIEDRVNGESRFSQIRGSYLGNGELDAEVLAEVGDLINQGVLGFVLAWHPIHDDSEDSIQYARILQIPQPRVLRTVVIEGIDGIPVTISPNLSTEMRYVVIGDLSFYDVHEYNFMRKEVEKACVDNNRPRAFFVDGGELRDYFTLNYMSFGENELLMPTVPNVWIIDESGRHICRAFTPSFYPATLEDLEDLDDDDNHTDPSEV